MPCCERKSTVKKFEALSQLSMISYVHQIGMPRCSVADQIFPQSTTSMEDLAIPSMFTYTGPLYRRLATRESLSLSHHSAALSSSIWSMTTVLNAAKNHQSALLSYTIIAYCSRCSPIRLPSISIDFQPIHLRRQQPCTVFSTVLSPFLRQP